MKIKLSVYGAFHLDRGKFQLLIFINAIDFAGPLIGWCAWGEKKIKGRIGKMRNCPLCQVKRIQLIWEINHHLIVAGKKIVLKVLGIPGLRTRLQYEIRFPKP